MRPSTFSIVAHDANDQTWGVAVASKFLAVGSVVPWAKAGVGAIATQAWANLSFGAAGLELLAQGKGAQEVSDELVESDDGREQRQLGVVDASGNPATYTGSECMDWAGGIAGDGFCAQGNILAGPRVIESIRSGFEESTGSLTERLLSALLAGDRAGGDRRGRQSSAILVVKEAGSYGGYTDKAVDLRVDDHTDPVPELIRLHKIHLLLFGKAAEEDLLEIDDEVGSEINNLLGELGAIAPGHERFDDLAEKALKEYMGTENLEERWVDGKIDKAVLECLRSKAAAT